MRITGALFLLSALTTVGCKDDAAQTRSAPSGATPQVAEPTPPAPAPKPAPTPGAQEAAPTPTAPTAEPSYDCAALVTPEDVKELCGIDVVVNPGSMEGQYAISKCQRHIHRADDKWNRITVQLQATSPAGAKSLVTLEVGDKDPAEKSLEVDAGDVARLVTRPDPLNGDLRQAFLAAKGPTYVQVTADTDKGKTALCAEDALVALGKRVVDRLP